MKRTGKIVVTACITSLLAIIVIAVINHRISISDEPIIIVDSYVNGLGDKTFVLSDGWMVETHLAQQSVRYTNNLHEEFLNNNRSSDKTYPNSHMWKNAEVGMPVEKHLDHAGKLYSYVPVLSKDSVKAHVVTHVSRYENGWDKMLGKIERFGDFLKETSGSGFIASKEMLYEKMFLNIYFEDCPPIMVNTAKNLSWLDVEPGCIVLAKTINGYTTFTPQL